MNQSGTLNIWGLQSHQVLALYIRDQNVTEMNSGKRIQVNSPLYGGGYWIDVRSGDIVGQSSLAFGQQTIDIPDFQTDIAFIAKEILPTTPDSLFRIDVNPRTEVLLNTPINTTRSFSIQITNTGKKPVTMIDGWTSSPSQILSVYFLGKRSLFPFDLNPSQSITIPVQYIMTDTGGAAVMLSFLQSASPSWENIAISATGAPKSAVTESKNGGELIRVFPDPANDLITIRLLPSLKERYTVSLSTIEGVRLAEKTIDDKNESFFDVSKFPDGTYTVAIYSQGGILGSKKVIIMH
jgi:hypothetical protein